MSELYSLPNGWEWKELQFFGKFIRGVSYKKEQLLESPTNDSFTLLRANNIQNELELDDIQIVPKDVAKGKEIKDGDILFAMSSGSKHLVGKNILLNGLKNYTFGAFCSIYRNQKNDVLNNYYLSYVLKSNLYRDKLSGLSMGANINNLKSSDLEIMKIPLPPLEEQKRIVAKLDILFAKIDKAIALHQKNIDEADIFMASVLNDVFVELEEKFQVKTLKDISNIISGYAFKSGDFSNDNKIKSIKITNVGVQNFVEEDDNFLPKELLNKLSKYTANYGDIAIALTRPYISNGLKVTYIPKTYDGAFINQRVAVIQSNKNFTSNHFIYYYLCTSSVLFNVMELSKTLNQPNLSIKDLSNFEIPLPPLKTQQKVVSYLDEISQKMEKIKQIQKEKMQSLKELKASILDKAFKGEL